MRANAEGPADTRNWIVSAIPVAKKNQQRNGRTPSLARIPPASTTVYAAVRTPAPRAAINPFLPLRPPADSANMPAQIAAPPNTPPTPGVSANSSVQAPLETRAAVPRPIGKATETSLRAYN